jgi:hypothetical protein
MPRKLIKKKVLCFSMAEDLYPKAKNRASELGFSASFSAYLEHVVRLDVELRSSPLMEETVSLIREQVVRQVLQMRAKERAQ